MQTYHRMQEIDVLIDQQPELARELVELDIRNQQAHKELQAFNDTGEFLKIHRLTIQRSYSDEQYKSLSTLKNEKPEEFLSEVTNTTQNIRRIESNINRKKYKSDEELKNWQENLSRAKIKQNILIQLLKS